MFEVNAANEFTVLLAREMQAEIIATGRPSAAKIKNAMSNPITWTALKQIGIIPADVQMIAGSIDPTNVALIATEDLSMALEHKQSIPSIEKKKVTLS
jgi:Na+/citrate or Na+/malate symporter